MVPVDVRGELRSKGYALVSADRLELAPELRGYEAALAREWEDLETDKYLKDGARFRERRYDRFHFVPRSGEVRLQPHRPYFQSDNANQYAGGIQRDVAPLTGTTLANALMRELIPYNFARFPVAEELGDELLDDPWDVQCHQFRIIGSATGLGEPTPEGPHRDEVDYGAIHLMSRTNVSGGASQVYSPEKELLTEFSLTERMDTMYWADRKVLHAVRPIVAADAGRTAVRDVLIFGYRHAPELGVPEAA